MKTFAKNLKPFIAYWVALAVWFVPAYMLDLTDTVWMTVFVAVLLILNGITGYTDGVKEIRWGIALFGVQLAAGAALCFVPGFQDDIFTISNILFLNQPFYTTSTAIEVIWAVGSVAVGLLPFFIGAAVRKKVPPEQTKTRLPWKRILANLKPFIAYWACLSAYMLLPSIFAVPADIGEWFETVMRAAFLVVLCVLNFVTGCTEGLKRAGWGIGLFGLQLAVCGALILVGENMGAYTLRMFGILGSAVVQMLFDFDYIATDPIAPPAIQIAVSVVVALVPFFIGAAVRWSVQKKKKADDQYRISTPQAEV